ncbi:MAG: DUF2177 family protein [Patescibacteria group bacterium]|nr:DUF2177 family protein [Patescibacteria group bacterium]
MLKYFYLYLATVPVFFALDMVWLGVVSKDLYRREMGALMRADVNWTAGIIFYLLYIIGIIYFAVSPGVKDSSLLKAVLNGALFGFMAYATYDLTGLAVIKDWSLSLTVIDIIWGTILTASVAAASFYLAKFIL